MQHFDVLSLIKDENKFVQEVATIMIREFRQRELLT